VAVWCVQFHRDGSRSCHIRWSRGSCGTDEGIGLPNRSSFVTLADMRASKTGTLKQIRERFTQLAPRYENTLYPAGGWKGTTSDWAHDPNNDANVATHNLPWPPYLDDEELAEVSVVAQEEKMKKKTWSPRKGRKSRKSDDPSYRATAEDEEDEEGEDKDEGDDSSSKRPTPERGGPKRKRGAFDPSFHLARADESPDDDADEPLRLKVKKARLAKAQSPGHMALCRPAGGAIAGQLAQSRPRAAPRSRRQERAQGESGATAIDYGRRNCWGMMGYFYLVGAG